MNKTIKNSLLLFAVILSACKADQIGYLDAKNASYALKEVTFKAALDPDDPADARRIEFHTPWQTSKLQGVDASMPPVYSIAYIGSENGDPVTAIRQFYINPGDGSISLAWDHTVPPGDYVFSIGISNENGANHEMADSILTITIE